MKVLLLSGQGELGEHGTFYGTSWHGYYDFMLGLVQPTTGKIKPVLLELKTKIGFGATMTIKKNAWSKEFVIPMPDTEWGNSQQVALYMRDCYNKTVDNPTFSAPITDAILMQLLYADGLACFVEYFFEYFPDKDEAHCYRVHCEEYPECSSPLDITIKLKDIADRWKKLDSFLVKNELPPPDFTRKYDVNDDRVQDATKTDLQKAGRNQILIGDVQCKYCAYRDLCSKDLGIETCYSKEELKIIKNSEKLK